MKPKNIFLVIVLLIFYWASTIPFFVVTEIFGVPINVANPIFLIGQSILFTLCGFSVTIQHLLIPLTVFSLVMVLFRK